MKINTIKHVNFGYNKSFHDNFQEELSNKTKNKSFAKSIISLDKAACATEDQILLQEKRYKTDGDNFTSLVLLLEEIKKIISFYAECYFPELNYAKLEFENYFKEVKKTKNLASADWRIEICDDLCTYTKETDPEFINYSHSAKQRNEYEAKRKFAAIEQQVVNPKSQTTAKTTEATRAVSPPQTANSATTELKSDLVQKFVPTQNSPNGFCDVVGMENIKKQFQSEILDYVDNPELKQKDFEEFGIVPPKGYLLYGPPGCGKTFVSQALAQEGKLEMFEMKISILGSKFVNQTANNIQKAFQDVFKYAQKQKKPVLLFLDEVDSIAIKRSDRESSGENLKATTTLLTLIEEAANKNVIVIACTNKYDLLDDAFKSRMSSKTYIGLPDEEQINALLINYLSKVPKGQNLASNIEEIKKLSKLLKGHSNRSIVHYLNSAKTIARNDNRSDITSEHIKKAIEQIAHDKEKEDNYKPESTKKKRVIGFSE